jgi:hypothetical protein
MTVVQKTTINNSTGMVLPERKKAKNKTVKPVRNEMTMQSTPGPNGYQDAAPSNKPNAGPATTSFTPAKYENNGYEGVKGKTNYSYDPSDDSLVENRITGLLDPESAMMRKGKSQSQNFMATRGLQSSSIANESALSTMIDKALPIASQDASTFGQADQMGWQNSFTAGQSNLSREHDASMFDKNAQFQTDSQNNQYSFQNDQSNADRVNSFKMEGLQQQNRLGLLSEQGKLDLAKMEKEADLTSVRDEKLNDNQKGLLNIQGQQNLIELEKNAELTASRDASQNEYQTKLIELQDLNQRGLLDAQGKQELEQMVKNSELTAARDARINQYEAAITDKQYLQDLQKTKLQYEYQDATFEKQVAAQQALDYRNSTASAYDNYLGQVAAVYSNPEMTRTQQTAGVAELKRMFEQQRQQLQAIYGYAGEDGDSSTAPDGQVPTTPVPSTIPERPTTGDPVWDHNDSDYDRSDKYVR